MKRLGVFQLFDVDGIISNYIYFLLDDLRKNVDDLMVIVCGEINGDSIDKLKKYTDRVYYRKNYGFDAYAFKDFFTKFIDINELQKYDELVLLNDTFYGPFYPFEQVFKEMAEESVDFWGLTMHKKTYDLEEHLQSFFIVIRKKMFLSHYFNEFWENLKLEKVDFYHLVHNYEVKFTQFFKEQGFSYSAYVKDDILNSDTLNNYNHYAYSPFQLIKYFKMPIIKRKVFTEGKDLSISAGEEIPEAFKYIKNHYNYDTDLIWEDLLRKYRLYDIKKQLNLNFVLPTKGNESHKKINKKIAVIAHLVYEDQLEKCKEYLYNIPNEIDIIITSYNDTILESLEKEFKKNERNMHTIKVINRGRDVAAIFVACKEIVKNYEYICFLHDKKTTGQKGMFPVGQSFQYLVWENLLASEDYIYRIVALLDSEKKLGLLSPPKPLHADYTYINVDEWGDNEDVAKEFVERMHLGINIERENPPFCLSTSFWCKKDALKALWEADLSIEDFPPEPCKNDGTINHVIERILGFVAQKAGYYSGIVETTEYASLDLQNKECVLRTPKLNLYAKNLMLAHFIGQCTKIYVYGAGIEARKVKNILMMIGRNPEGYIISDEYFDKCDSKLSPLIKFSDVLCEENVGIIVGMNSSNTEEVKPIIKKRGFNNVFYFNLGC